MHSGDSTDDVDGEKRGKMRRITADDGNAMPVDGASGSSTGGQGSLPFLPTDKPEKKPRKKWTMEETHMLVAGCNKVRARDSCARTGPFC